MLDVQRGNGPGRAAAGAAVALLCQIAFFEVRLVAQDLTGYVEIKAGQGTARTDLSGSQQSEAESFSLFRRYGFDATWRLFPSLRLSLGGNFEATDTQNTLNGIDLPDAQFERLQPYLSLLLRNPTYSAEFRYNRLEDRTTSGNSPTRDIQDVLSAILGWRPERLPRVRLRAQRTDAYDGARERQDVTFDLLDLSIEDTVSDSLRLSYRGRVDETNDRIEELRLQRISHTGRASYGDSWLGGRLQVAADYLRSDQSTKVLSSGSGEIPMPLLAVVGLSATDDFPEEVELEANPALIDENLTASAGIDLGLEPSAEEEGSRNLGLDFGEETTVDRLRVTIDRDLPESIANSFRWRIYSSSNNRQWLLEEAVAVARFDGFSRRFELRFREVRARYVKAVTEPLARSVVSSSEYPDILVTEFEAFDVVPAAELGDEVDITREAIASSLRGRLLEQHALFYEFSYSERRLENSLTSSQLSHGLAFSEPLTPKLTLSTRVAREEARGQQESLSYPYGASLRASWLPTLEQRLVFSGRKNESPGSEGSDRGIFLYTSAELYRGVQVDLALGSGEQQLESGEQSDFDQVSGRASLTPHQSLTVVLEYQTREEVFTMPATQNSRVRQRSRSEISATYAPFPAAYFFGAYRLEESSNQRDRTTRNVGLSWAPFSGGNLQLTVRYDESYQSQLDTLFKVFSPRVRWNVTNRWYAELAWENSTSDQQLQQERRNVVSINSRLSF